jgi:hypothetical protein
MSNYDELLKTPIQNEDKVINLVYNLCKVSHDQIGQHPDFRRNDDISVCSTLAMAFLGRAMALTPDGNHKGLIATIVENGSTLSDLIRSDGRGDVIDMWLEVIKEQTGYKDDKKDS